MSPAWQRLWWWTKRVAPWALAALVLALVAQQARAVDWAQVGVSLRQLSPARVALAVGLVALSYAVYAGFDLVGRHLTRHGLSVPRTLGTAAISYAFNLNFGALVGGFAMRLRLYTRWGVAAATVAKVIALSMTTNWLGYLWVTGGVLLWSPPALPGGWAPGDAVLRALGAAMVVLALAYLVLCAVSRPRTLRWRDHELALPGGRLALAQALAVHPMTISKAYSLLESDGVLERRRGLSMVVAARRLRRNNPAQTSSSRDSAICTTTSVRLARDQAAQPIVARRVVRARVRRNLRAAPVLR